ncbi:MAG: winged helix-turn-helix domain-containing protein [Moraxella sp.]|nr:winged helix-turn-helix domain-containing protein [Moraxella sp.]
MNTITHTLKAHDFGKLAKTETKARARTRLYVLHQYSIGKQSAEIAQNLCINAQVVRTIKRRYLQHGIKSIYDKHRKGRNSKLANEHIESFKALIVKEQSVRGGGRLIGEDIRQLAKEHYQAEYTVNGIYELLKRIGITWISARSKHPKRDLKAQEDFKKTLSTM